MGEKNQKQRIQVYEVFHGDNPKQWEERVGQRNTFKAAAVQHNLPAHHPEAAEKKKAEASAAAKTPVRKGTSKHRALDAP